MVPCEKRAEYLYSYPVATIKRHGRACAAHARYIEKNRWPAEVVRIGDEPKV